MGDRLPLGGKCSPTSGYCTHPRIKSLDGCSTCAGRCTGHGSGSDGGHAEFWKAWNSEKSWIRKVLVLEFTPFLYFNRFLERVPFMVHLFSFALAFGPSLDLPLWAYLALWAYALECVVVCAGHRYSPFVKKGLEWMTFGPKNLKFFLEIPGSVGIRGAAWGFSVYALYKYELHKYNEARKGFLNDAIIHAQLSAKVAMQSLPENGGPRGFLEGI